MKEKSLRFKLIAGGVLAVLIPLISIGYFAVTKASDALEGLSEEQVVNLSEDLSAMTQLVLTEEIKLVKEISSDHNVQDAAETVAVKGSNQAAGKVEALDQRLTGIMDSIGSDYEVLFIAGPDGTIYSDGVGGSYKDISISDRSYFQNVKKGDAIIDTPIESKVTGKPVVPAAAPIKGNNGEFLGALVSIVKTEFFAEKITSVKIGETGYPFMVDQNGTVVVHPDGDIILETNLKDLAGMEEISQAALAGQTGVKSYNYQGNEKIGGFSPVNLTGWSVITTQTADEFMSASNTIRNFIAVMTLVFLGITLSVVIFFSNGLSRRIINIVQGLNQSSVQVASASSQVASTSQSLAEGSSEQASSLEETSSSIEQMASQTRQNSNNADQADSAVKETVSVVEKGVDSMQRMNSVINEIKESSNETSKIIKTIDDIAFQTNLLALNAAVEAARAGEAGKGFAVVAEEVRNLAQRSAEAAQNTAQLIEKSQENAGNGVSVAEEVATQLDSIKESSSKVNTLISEITAASKEQAQGLDQVNTAVSEMDKVVQQNAADSEESASAAEELSSQATEMEKMVAELEAVVGGSSTKQTVSESNSSQVRGRKQEHQSKRSKPQPLSRNQKPSSKKHGKSDEQRSNKTAGKRAQANSAEQVIPLDDKDFKDF